jgi:hypothetical protein
VLDFKRFGVNIDNQYDNIIGLDFGHGEISAALWKLNNQNVGDKPMDLSFNSNDKHKIYTALFIAKDGTCKIGDEALRNKSGTGKLYTCFKARPVRLVKNERFPNDTITKKQLVQIFFREIIKTLYQYNRPDLEGNNIILVGCPSGRDWLEDDNDIVYARILSEGLNQNIPIVIMPESRAAIIKVIKERGSIDLTKGAVVFDFGSSTSDSTYMYIKGSTAIDIDTSEPLGASYIEQEMLEDFFEGKRRRETLKDEENAKMDLRGVKEAHYLSPQGELAATVSFLDGVEAKMVDREYMQQITHQNEISYINNEKICVRGNWVKLCRDFLYRIRELLRSKPLGTVLLTGGASRMPFIQALCMDTFPYSNLIVDQDPSYCVSRGLAWAGKTDLEAQKAFQSTLLSIQSFLSAVDYDRTHLINNIITGIADGIYLDIHEKVVRQELLNWKNTKVNESPNDLCIHMNERFHVVIAQEDIQKKIKRIIAEQLKKSQSDIIAIIDKNYKSIYGQSVPKDYQFVITDEMLNKLRDRFSNIKMSLNSSSTVNQALGLFGFGQVAMGAHCLPGDRAVKADRALTVPSRVTKLKELCKTEIRFDLRYGKKVDFKALVDEIMMEFTPQIEKMVESLALYFAK